MRAGMGSLLIGLAAVENGAAVHHPPDSAAAGEITMVVKTVNATLHSLNTKNIYRCIFPKSDRPVGQLLHDPASRASLL
jgi:hypothetical protein